MGSKRFLGIDFGEKRVGIALSDDGGKLAFPFKIIPNNESLLDMVHNICGEGDVAEIVIGESKNFSGGENTIMGKINNFKEELEKLGLPVHFEKEFLTTVEARGRGGKEINNARPARNAFSLANAGGKTKGKQIRHVDASAAALILQRYLDKRNLQKGQI